MEGKKKRVQFLAVIILAALIFLGIGICLFLYFQQGTEKLSQTTEPESGTETNEMAEEVPQEESKSEAIEAFVITGADSGADQNEKKQEKEAGAETGEYLCSYSSERQMTEADVSELRSGTYEDLPEGKNIIRMVINELYAKYGYQFNNEEIQKYFEQKQWYQDITVRNKDMDSIFKGMTDIEKSNVEFLSAFGEEEE